MWFWQRREVYMGRDGPQLCAVRTALERAGIAFECVARSGHNYTGADRRMTNARSAAAERPRGRRTAAQSRSGDKRKSVSHRAGWRGNALFIASRRFVALQ